MTFALQLDGVHKRFGAVEALLGASMRVRRGTVHALLGENGAGKTTLMRVVYGMVRPDAGTIQLDGAPVTLRRSADAIARGVGMVHQHFSLVPAMTVAENVALGMHGRYDARAAAARVRAVCVEAGLTLDPESRVDTLPVGAQQRLEIVKALARDARLLILDEPTAVLAPNEADELLHWVRRFRDAGRTVILITHKLREALSIADDVTVLRRGTSVMSGDVTSLGESTLVAALLGDDPSRTEISPRPGAVHPGAVVAKLQGVFTIDQRGTPALRDVSLTVRAREIIGIAAIEGSGQHDLLRVLAGRIAPTHGDAILPDAVAFIPEDRQRDALILDMSLVENIALRGLGARRGQMPWDQLRATTVDVLARFEVRATGPTATGRSLSGGNQQKLVLGRELAAAPTLVVAENPTRGLDLRSMVSIIERLRAARDQGSAVVFYSSDLDEVLEIADRIVVVHAGHVVSVETPSRESVGRAMLGAT